MLFNHGIYISKKTTALQKSRVKGKVTQRLE